MSWVFFALISALLFAFQRVYEKRILGTINFVSIGWLVQLFAFPVWLVVLFWKSNIPHIASLPFQFWWPLLIIWLILYPLQTYAFYRALHEGELSRVLPILSVTPIVNILSAWLLVGEVPSLYGVLGILATVVSLFVLLRDKPTDPQGRRDWLPIFLMFVFAVCVAIGTTLDKVVLQVADPYFYTVANKVGAVIVLFIMARLMQGGELVHFKKRSVWISFCVIGFMAGVSYVFFMLALSSGPVAYVGAIKSTNLIFGSLLGVAFLAEKMTRRKVISYLLMLSGIILIAFA